MPVEKLRLRPWLESTLDSGHIPGVKWIDPREKIFQVSWKHASRQGWCLDTDACIFKEWAIHTGRYRQQYDKPDPRRWKANFRCALNALPDIKELQARGVTRGNNAYKVYQMLTKSTDNATKNKKDSTDVKGTQAKVQVSKYIKPMVSTTTPVIKRHSVIHKSSTVIQDPKSRRTICTSHPVNPQSLFPFWPTYTAYSPYPHMKDHDYLTTWYDPRPEMRDIGVMTYQEIKKEPTTPDEQNNHSQHYDQDAVVALTDEHYINNVKEEKTIPSDEEIIDLVDRMSRDSDTASNGSGSSFDEYDADLNDQDKDTITSPRATETRPTSIMLKPRRQSDEYMLTYGYQGNDVPPPPLTPESASEILKGFAAQASQ